MNLEWITQLPFAVQIAIVILVGLIWPCFVRDVIRYVHRKRKRLRDLKECIKWLQPDLEATEELNNTDFVIMCNRLFSGCRNKGTVIIGRKTRSDKEAPNE